MAQDGLRQGERRCGSGAGREVRHDGRARLQRRFAREEIVHGGIHLGPFGADLGGLPLQILSQPLDLVLIGILHGGLACHQGCHEVIVEHEV